ncbi:MAG: peptide chain release factor N(5)-glutamine methyltransferase [Bacteroidota bacterium]|nr:peptide chain release factor N(5)-glutamine methyltransferase [Bacteroidota bacterium]
MTIDELYKHFVGQLKTIYDERESENITDWIFESIAKIRRLDRLANKQKAISDSTINQLNNALQQLLQHKPVQYVLQEVWFYKMKLFVNEHVLIPRPETEELVEWIIKEFRIQNSEFRILDIGSGCGCIPIALKKELPNTEIISIDISEDALAVAKKNAADQNVKIDFKRVDFLNEKSWTSLPLFNIIVSNPPYIPENEKSKLNKNVTDHEPHTALFVADSDPFIFYRKIADFAETHLVTEGKIFVEIHENYSEQAEKIFAEKEFKTERRNDIYGRERMVKVYR